MGKKKDSSFVKAEGMTDFILVDISRCFEENFGVITLGGGLVMTSLLGADAASGNSGAGVGADGCGVGESIGKSVGESVGKCLCKSVHSGMGSGMGKSIDKGISRGVGGVAVACAKA